MCLILNRFWCCTNLTYLKQCLVKQWFILVICRSRWFDNTVICLSGYKMNKRVGGITEFEFEPLSSGRSLCITIAITGWLSEKHYGIASTLSH